ncbi:hypothetical protein Q5P01_009102 [Channa striata]|uniref:SOWAHA-C winged helix-turn-helix domain-containing protein n=1 Tax=Channa striata TaxID=64152 RepID=A0AA88N587_CHASR|nr:hypothetical protein Q5P01_009102 [Channa striata]
MALTQESILSFLLENGGKVKNSELVNNFRGQISCSDPAEKQHNRELFKKLVNSVAVVKQIDQVKFVVAKKRYQDFVKEAAHDASPKTQMDESFSSHNTSVSHTSPHRAESARMIYSDIENNNTCYLPNGSDSNLCGAKHTPVGSVQGMRQDATTVKVMTSSTARKSGAVFAVIAVKSPPRDSEPAPQDGPHVQVNRHGSSDKPITLGAAVPTVSVPTLNSDAPPCMDAFLRGTQCGKSGPTGDMQPPECPQMRPPNKTTRQTEDAKYTESVPLEPLAHEWLVKCAAGLWGQIYVLLLLDTRLAQKKDFMSGFTALHWAAKDGNSEMIHTLIDISRKRGTYININSKAHGGYTPLHIAAIHGHTDVMVALVQGYGADVTARDNDGKKPFHYLGNGASAEIRRLLGGLQQRKYSVKREDEEYTENPKGFNTISKLFQPHLGRKQKASNKFAPDW